MILNDSKADIFIPDGSSADAALSRTTHLCIGAHQDDQEFMAYHGISECFGRSDKWFSGVVVTDGGGSARSGIYASYSDEEMRSIRSSEQRKAAVIGEYACQIQLRYPSSAVKDPVRSAKVVNDILQILESTTPEKVYLHNPADKHDTHVAVVACSLAALRKLAPEKRPEAVYGCEIWRSLDWLCDGDKQVLPVDSHPNLAMALSGVFDSQITGGKRYDKAVAGRREANATFFESHETDSYSALSWGMDLTPLILQPELDMVEYTVSYIDRFRDDVAARLRKFIK